MFVDSFEDHVDADQNPDPFFHIDGDLDLASENYPSFWKTYSEKTQRLKSFVKDSPKVTYGKV